MEEVTLLIHGTFANPRYDAGGVPEDEERWWRPGPNPDGTPNIAMRLDEELGNLWSPGRDQRDGDLGYRDLCEWSGRNTHKARVAAAENLATSLKLLADRRGCIPDKPLHVNFVAHSHGGNVVLEALKHVSDNVRPRQLCLLGTPLTWRLADLRVVYLPALVIFLWQWGKLFHEDIASPLLDALPWLSGAGTVVGSSAQVGLYVLVLPLLLWLGAMGISFARASSRWFSREPGYGPRPQDLEDQLRGRSVVLYISQRDEADLMLQLGAAPLDTYRAMVKGRPTLRHVRRIQSALLRLLLRYIEVAYIRPFSYVVLVPWLEILLERYALGFPWRHVLLNDHEMETWSDSKTYQPTQVRTERIRHEDLLRRESTNGQAVTRELRVPLARGGAGIGYSGEERRMVEKRRGREYALRTTLVETVNGLKDQVHLRHSGYYTSEPVIRRVAEQIRAN